MADLKADQSRFMAVLERGPSAYPDGLFAGEPDRALLGLKAHANTISHARLVALEDSYPRTRDAMGHAAFNAASRTFAELAPVRRRKLMQIGQGFAEFLAGQGEVAAICDLAAVEWQWLQAYHAAEAAPLWLADLAGLDEAALLDLRILRHPAARLLALDTDIEMLLPELGDRAAPGLRNLLICRPEAEVLLTALTPVQADIAALAGNADTMRNLLMAAIEQAGEAEALPAILSLIGAAMLARPQD
jgi:hypothetical protein